MTLKTTFYKPFCKRFIADLLLKKTTLVVLLFCCMVYTSKGQSHDDSTVVLEKSAFSVTFNHTPDGLLKFELINNMGFDISPFFIETYVKGYNLDETHIEQSLNNMIVTDNIERVFGPQFMGLGISTLPAFGNYQTTFVTAGKTNEASTIILRISGTMNGQPVIWFSSFRF